MSRFGRDEIIGVANEMAPHYFSHLTRYREEHPGTLVGQPGRYQVSHEENIDGWILDPGTWRMDPGTW